MSCGILQKTDSGSKRPAFLSGGAKADQHKQRQKWESMRARQAVVRSVFMLGFHAYARPDVGFHCTPQSEVAREKALAELWKKRAREREEAKQREKEEAEREKKRQRKRAQGGFRGGASGGAQSSSRSSSSTGLGGSGSTTRWALEKLGFVGVSAAEREQIPHAQFRKAYHKLARVHHPDKNPDNVAAATARFQDIEEAYSILSE